MNDVLNRLERISLLGFKTLNPLDHFKPVSKTVLIGPNGAGKSNFISFFHMMSYALSGSDQLARYVGQQGGSRRILHDGPESYARNQGHINDPSSFGNERLRLPLIPRCR